jgi:multidrug efflux pump
MTSLAFVMGVLPLVLSTGAGSEMRKAMGVAVFAGMIGVTAFGLFLTPVFYVLLRRLAGNRPLKLHGEVPHGDDFVSAEHPATPASQGPHGGSGGGGLHPVPASPRPSHDD